MSVTNFQRAIHTMQTEERFVTMAMYLMQMEIVADESVGTAETDCVRTIWYSPTYFENATVEQCVTALMHEGYHKFLNFFPRFERWAALYPNVPRDKLLSTFNKAQDLFINWILKHQWHLPIWADWYYHPDANPAKHTTESIANQLLEDEESFGPPPQAPSQPPEEGDEGEDEQGQASSGPTDDQSEGNTDADEGDGEEGEGDADEGDGEEGEGDADGEGEGNDGDGEPDESDGDGEPDESDGDGDSEGEGEGEGEQAPAEAGKGSDIRLPEEYEGDINNVPSPQALHEMEVDNAANSHSSSRMTQPMRAIGGGSGASDPFLQQIEESQYKATHDWAGTLRRYAESAATNNFSYSRRSRRNIARNQPIRPGKVGKEVGTCVFVIDSSGSTSGQAIAYALAELQRALDTATFEKAVVIWCAEGIGKDGVVEYQMGDTVDTTRRGLGFGTRFMPAFERIAEEYKDAAVISYLTDGGVPVAEVERVNELWRTQLGSKPLVWGLVHNGWACTDNFIVAANKLGCGKVCELPMNKIVGR